MVIINVHAPAQDKEDNSSAESIKIIVGDFNAKVE
jgi:hypothetical protein